jgi:hypothetical protein
MSGPGGLTGEGRDEFEVGVRAGRLKSVCVPGVRGKVERLQLVALFKNVLQAEEVAAAAVVERRRGGGGGLKIHNHVTAGGQTADLVIFSLDKVPAGIGAVELTVLLLVHLETVVLQGQEVSHQKEKSLVSQWRKRGTGEGEVRNEITSRHHLVADESAFFRVGLEGKVVDKVLQTCKGRSWPALQRYVMRKGF